MGTEQNSNEVAGGGSALNAGLEALAEEWHNRAKDLRGQSLKVLSESGISKAMRDYAVIHYEDRADELMRVLAANAELTRHGPEELK